MVVTGRSAEGVSAAQERDRPEAKARAAIEVALDHALPGAKALDFDDVWRGQVYRVRVKDGDGTASVIAKRFRPEKGALEQRVLVEWLPAKGLGWVSPRLLGVSAKVDGRVWHLYEDVGRRTIDQLHGEPLAESIRIERGFMTPLGSSPDPGLIHAAMVTIASVHAAFADHERLNEYRRAGQPHGATFYRESIVRARTALTAAAPSLRRADRSLLDGLFARLDRLAGEQAARLSHLAEVGGSDTLLHGDFSIRNTLIVGDGDAREGRLIDWDRAGVGPVSEDISVFLAQLPPEVRSEALATYLAAYVDGANAGRSVDDWNRLFETAELARLASCIVGPAHLVAERPTQWAVGSLQAVEDWFEGLRPLLAVGPAGAARWTSAGGQEPAS